MLEGILEKEKVNTTSLIELLNLKVGTEISLTKIAKSANAEIKNGEKFQGPILKDVNLGRPIDIRGFSTSAIRDIREDNGKYYVLTQNSLYELALLSAPKKQEAVVQKPESLIDSLGLKKGKVITLQKIDQARNSNVKVGTKIHGPLLEDVSVGEQVFVGNLQTSKIREIREDRGRYFLVTQTSLYELFLTAEKNTTPEQSSNLYITLSTIERNLNKQPQSIQENWEMIKKNVVRLERVQGRQHIFSSIAIGSTKPEAMALVQSDTDPDSWKMRVFRFSESDHQWKSFPGKRMDGSFLKGDEGNPLHHYVQSAKLHKDVYQVLESLPKSPEDPRYDDLLPVDTHGNDGLYEDELEFKEKYQQLKNPEWANYQNFCQAAMSAYDAFVGVARTFKDFRRTGKLYKTLEGMEGAPAIRALKKTMDAMIDARSNEDDLQSMSLSTAPREFRTAYQTHIGQFLESMFRNVEPPKSLLPDFSETNKKAQYEKTDLQSAQNEKIFIEEYEVNSPEGDVLVFAMARDSKNRVYIDNIYDPRVPASNYGTMDTITQMGYLIYKPEDYREQTEFGIPEQYKKPIEKSRGRYVDISALWENLPIIQAYKKELKQRGVVKE